MQCDFASHCSKEGKFTSCGKFSNDQAECNVYFCLTIYSTMFNNLQQFVLSRATWISHSVHWKHPESHGTKIALSTASVATQVQHHASQSQCKDLFKRSASVESITPGSILFRLHLSQGVLSTDLAVSRKIMLQHWKSLATSLVWFWFARCQNLRIPLRIPWKQKAQIHQSPFCISRWSVPELPHLQDHPCRWSRQCLHGHQLDTRIPGVAQALNGIICFTWTHLIFKTKD